MQELDLEATVLLAQPRAQAWCSDTLKSASKIARKLTKSCFIAPIPNPLSLFASLHQPGFLQNAHVMGNRRLGEVHALLHITCAKARLFPDGTSALFFKGVEDTAARGIGDRVQHFIQRLLGGAHDEEVCRRK